MQSNSWNVYAPATGEKIASMKETSVEEIGGLYRNSEQAFKEWSQLSVSERLVYFNNLRKVLLRRLEETTDVVSSSTGKVKLDALASDIMPVLDFLLYADKEAPSLLKRRSVTTPIFFFGKKSFIEYMPMGTVLVISPWNYPFQLSMVPILSAIVSGNTVIVKPSEVTPYVGAWMEKLFKEALFPEGVVQFAHGGKEIGSALVERKPHYIFFTGSVATGKIIAQQAANKLIPVTLELGGKDPMIVCYDANLERAAKAAVWGAFTNSGQVCMSVERLYVDERIYEPFLQAVKKEVSLLSQGISKDDDIGSMTYSTQVEIVKKQIDEALEQGAVLQTGRQPSEWEEGNHFIQPMVLTNVTDEMKIVCEETFGPVLPIMTFKSEEEAIERANNSEYGLNASVWSNDVHKAEKLASKLISGAVMINDVIVSVANHHLPFGGAKQSGIGRYHGEQGLRMFCYEKAIMVDSGKKENELQWYPYRGKYDDFKQLVSAYFAEHKKWLLFVKSYLKLMKRK
ncbi:MAG: aldehyde dehydrogenase family protein [Bacillus sp. (in: firmicutes)]